eukprot:scaffold103335_cov33-Prasinocladus_malaysianus.AAC.1
MRLAAGGLSLQAESPAPVVKLEFQPSKDANGNVSLTPKVQSVLARFSEACKAQKTLGKDEIEQLNQKGPRRLPKPVETALQKIGYLYD